MPQHHPPPLGQPGEGAGGGAPFEFQDGRVGYPGDDLVGAEVVGELQPPVPPPVGVEAVAQGGVEVRPEGGGRAAAALHRGEHPGERLAHQVFGRAGVAGEPGGQAPGRVDVPQVEHSERVGVAGAGRREQRGVVQ